MLSAKIGEPKTQSFTYPVCHNRARNMSRLEGPLPRIHSLAALCFRSLDALPSCYGRLTFLSVLCQRPHPTSSWLLPSLLHHWRVFCSPTKIQLISTRAVLDHKSDIGGRVYAGVCPILLSFSLTLTSFQSRLSSKFHEIKITRSSSGPFKFLIQWRATPHDPFPWYSCRPFIAVLSSHVSRSTTVSSLSYVLAFKTVAFIFTFRLGDLSCLLTWMFYLRPYMFISVRGIHLQ